MNDNNGNEKRSDCEHSRQKVFYPLGEEFEAFINDNSLRADVAAGVISLVFDTLHSAHDEWESAKNHNDKCASRWKFLQKTSTLIPVLDMLNDYMKESKVHAYKVHDHYEAACFPTKERGAVHE